MTTMLYEKETLVPCLLTNTDINNDDVDVKFYVINGAWDGTFTKGRVLIHHPDYGSKDYNCEFKCYIFNEDDDINSMYYSDVFVYFKELVKKGVVNNERN